MTAELDESGRIVFTDKETKDEQYTIPAPFMYDAAGNESFYVSYELVEESEGQYKLILSADEEWLNSSDTIYPVTIDPSLTSNSAADTYIYASHATTNYGSGIPLWICSDRITYIRTYLPSLPTYAKVTDSTLSTYYYYYDNITSGTVNIGLYKCENTWSESSLTWNVANSYDNMGLSTTRSTVSIATATSTTHSSSPGIVSFSITDIMMQWYAGETNRGVGLKYEGGSNASVILMSKESAIGYRPYVTVTYSTPTPVINNGTYFFKNGKLGNYMQIDNDDSSNAYCTNDAILELFDFDGNAYQKWTITYLHNGYYKITSAKSGKAVSVKSGKENTGEQALRQQTYIADFRQQWKITSAHNGQYKIKPRSSEGYSTDWVMAAGDGVGTNGRNVEQRKYVNNTSYLDEWYMYKIGGNDVLFVAITDTDGRDRVSEFGNIFGYLYDYGYTDFNFIYTDYISKTNCIAYMENASIFVSRSHGGYDTNSTWIRLFKDGTSSRLFSTDIYNTSALVDFSSLDIAIFAACDTAKNTNTGKNLADASVNAGANYAIGFNDTISCSDANNWVEYFFYYRFVNGYSIEYSCTKATNNVSGMTGKCYIAH